MYIKSGDKFLSNKDTDKITLVPLIEDGTQYLIDELSNEKFVLQKKNTSKVINFSEEVFKEIEILERNEKWNQQIEIINHGNDGGLYRFKIDKYCLESKNDKIFVTLNCNTESKSQKFEIVYPLIANISKLTDKQKSKIKNSFYLRQGLFFTNYDELNKEFYFDKIGSNSIKINVEQTNSYYRFKNQKYGYFNDINNTTQNNTTEAKNYPLSFSKNKNDTSSLFALRRTNSDNLNIISFKSGKCLTNTKDKKLYLAECSNDAPEQDFNIKEFINDENDFYLSSKIEPFYIGGNDSTSTATTTAENYNNKVKMTTNIKNVKKMNIRKINNGIFHIIFPEENKYLYYDEEKDILILNKKTPTIFDVMFKNNNTIIKYKNKYCLTQYYNDDYNGDYNEEKEEKEGLIGFEICNSKIQQVFSKTNVFFDERRMDFIKNKSYENLNLNLDLNREKEKDKNKLLIEVLKKKASDLRNDKKVIKNISNYNLISYRLINNY